MASHSCSGCFAPAKYYAHLNESLFFCSECDDLLKLDTRPLASRGATRCFVCDHRTFHEMEICTFCCLGFMHDLAYLSGLDSLDNNPALYRLLIPHIKFIESLNMDSPSCSRTWYRFFFRGCDWHDIDFSRVANLFEDSY